MATKERAIGETWYGHGDWKIMTATGVEVKHTKKEIDELQISILGVSTPSTKIVVAKTSIRESTVEMVRRLTPWITARFGSVVFNKSHATSEITTDSVIRPVQIRSKHKYLTGRDIKEAKTTVYKN
jgi:hypothetical protein